jgi:starvation-inducible DNA-binding protein
MVRDMKTGMNEKARREVADAIQHLLADSYAVYLKTQNFHWNVKGPNFYSLHIFFEKQYTEMADAVDEIAERIQALGFYVEASFSAFEKACCMKEEKKPINAKKMIEILLADHEALICCARQIGALAEKEDDQATVDLMARRLGAHEKFAWMLRSHLSG